MKFCPNCGTQVEDEIVFCPKCGFNFAGGPAAAQADPSDHTAEFDPKDISENKVIAMLPYLMSFAGVIIALLAINNSAYVAFNVKQALKITVCEILLLICCVIPILGWIVAGVGIAICGVLGIIGFINVCKGKAKELPIIKKLGFLK